MICRTNKRHGGEVFRGLTFKSHHISLTSTSIIFDSKFFNQQREPKVALDWTTKDKDNSFLELWSTSLVSCTPAVIKPPFLKTISFFLEKKIACVQALHICIVYSRCIVNFGSQRTLLS